MRNIIVLLAVALTAGATEPPNKVLDPPRKVTVAKKVYCAPTKGDALAVRQALEGHSMSLFDEAIGNNPKVYSLPAGTVVTVFEQADPQLVYAKQMPGELKTLPKDFTEFMHEMAIDNGAGASARTEEELRTQRKWLTQPCWLSESDLRQPTETAPHSKGEAQ